MAAPMAASTATATATAAAPALARRTVLFPAADDPLCEAAFDYALDNVFQPGDALVLVHVALAEHVASGAGGGGGGGAAADATATAAGAPSSPPTAAEAGSAAARAYSDALPSADYFYAPARPAAELAAVQQALDRRFLRKLADVREGQMSAPPKLIVVKAAADPLTVARLVCEMAQREGAHVVVLTGSPDFGGWGVAGAAAEEGGGGGAGGSGRRQQEGDAATAKGGGSGGTGRRQQRDGKGPGAWLAAAFGGLLGRKGGGGGGGGGDLPRSRKHAREREADTAPVGVAGRHILRGATCGVVVLRPVASASPSHSPAQRTGSVAREEAAAAAAAERAREAAREDEPAEEDELAAERAALDAEAARLPETFEVIEYGAVVG